MLRFWYSLPSKGLSAAEPFRRGAARERYEELRHRVKDELCAHAILFEAQRRGAEQPEHCATCVAGINAAAALHEALDEEDGEASSLETFRPYLEKRCKRPSTTALNGN